MQPAAAIASVLPATALAVATALAAPGALATSGEAVERVLQGLQEARERESLPALERDATLDAIAAERAREIASRPHRRRLAGREPIESALARAGVRDWVGAVEHLDLKRGYDVPSAAVLQTILTSPKARRAVLDERTSAVGLGAAVAEDGWLVFVAVLVQRRGPPPDLRDLERRTVEAVNAIRRERGLAPLEAAPALDRVARAHSEDMARRDYFDHRSPDGRQPEDRARIAGIRYSRLAENIQLNNDAYDPVRVAVDSWMTSKGHRRNILDPGFLQTGIGVALSEEGVFYLTQLFLE